MLATIQTFSLSLPAPLSLSLPHFLPSLVSFSSYLFPSIYSLSHSTYISQCISLFTIFFCFSHSSLSVRSPSIFSSFFVDLLFFFFYFLSSIFFRFFLSITS